MSQEQEKKQNESVARGVWGEDVALDFLRRKGWRLVGRRVRPCARDRRCEIDLIVRTRDRRSIAFVEVKTHRARSPRASRLWCVDKRKKSVVQVYGTPDAPTPPEIDHIENVPLFPPKWRFW